MITFAGAGPGAADLITVRGQRLLQEADIVVYAGSLVNPELLSFCRDSCQVYNSAKMTLEEVMEVLERGEAEGKRVVRLHTGDPCLYGAIKEQMDRLDEKALPMKYARGSAHSVGLLRPLRRSIHFPAYPSLW